MPQESYYEEQKRIKKAEKAFKKPTAYPGKKVDFKPPTSAKRKTFASPKEMYDYFFRKRKSTSGQAASKFPPSLQTQTKTAKRRKFEAAKALINPAYTKWDKRQTDAIKQIDDKYWHLRHSNPRKGADAIALWNKQNPSPPKTLTPTATPEIKGIEERVEERRQEKKKKWSGRIGAD